MKKLYFLWLRRIFEASMASSESPPAGSYLGGLFVGLVVGDVGCFFMLFPVAAYLQIIVKLFGLDERASIEAQRHILIWTYAAWFAGFTFNGAFARKGPFVSGFLASLPAVGVWLFIAWQAHS